MTRRRVGTRFGAPPAPQCTRPGCSRTTKHPSRRCYQHQVPFTDGETSGRIPDPTSPAPKPKLLHLANGTVVRAQYENEAGRKHRVGGPALIEYYNNGVKKNEAYLIDGTHHREDGPAEIGYDTFGNVEYEVYREHGEFTRTDGGPAIRRYLKGNLVSEEWQVANKEHRLDGPATVNYYLDGSVKDEQWYVEGVMHRTGAPAIVRNREDGTRYGEEWYRKGSPHRLDGPARVIYAEDGVTPMNNEGPWILYGEYLDTPDRLAARLAEKSDAKIAAEFSQCSYAPLVDDSTDLRAALGAIGQGVRTLDGIREVLGGAPAEWVRAYEQGRS